jgi:hypothetical protein
MIQLDEVNQIFSMLHNDQLIHILDFLEVKKNISIKMIFLYLAAIDKFSFSSDRSGVIYFVQF